MWLSFPCSSMMNVLRSVMAKRVFPRMVFSPNTPYAVAIDLSESLINGKGSDFFWMKFSWLWMESVLMPKRTAFEDISLQRSRISHAWVVQPGVESLG